MNAIEIRGLTKSFRGMYALCGLDMTVPVGAIYGFIGENGSGKSTTEKIICGLLPKSGGEVTLFGKPHTESEAREKMGVLIEAPGCYPNLTVWNNMMIHAANLGIKNGAEAVRSALITVRMEGAAGNKFKNCSLGMKQRVGIAMALLGDPDLFVLDEPLNGLDADGMRIMREVLTDLARQGKTVLVSSHLLGELEKVATRYGIVKGGKMIREMTAEELTASCPTFVSLKAGDMQKAEFLLRAAYPRVEKDEEEFLRVYEGAKAEEVAALLYRGGVTVTSLKTDKIGLEEYYLDLMKTGDR